MWGDEAGQATVLLQIPSPRGETGPEDDQSGAHERRGLAQGLSYPHPGAVLSAATCLRSRCGLERAGTGKRRKTREGSIYVCYLLLHNKLPPHLAGEESEHLLCHNTDLTEAFKRGPPAAQPHPRAPQSPVTPFAQAGPAEHLPVCPLPELRPPEPGRGDLKSRSHRKDSRRGGHGPAQCQDDCSLKTHHQPFLRFPATLVPESHWSETSNFLEATQRAGLHCSTLKPGPVWLGAAATSQRFELMHRSHFETLFTTALKNIFA